MNRVVLEHVLDETAGVYRLTYASEEWVEQLNDAGEPETVAVRGDPREVIFDAGDDRWFADGHRRPADAVAAEQRTEVAAALAAQDAAAAAQPERRAIDLLGGGDPPQL